MDLVIIMTLLLVLLAAGGFYVRGPGYSRGPAGLGTILYALAAVVLIIIIMVLRLLYV